MKTDQILSKLLLLEWAFGILIACVVTPYSWNGNEFAFHINLYLSIFLGALLSWFPFFLVSKKPGARINRYVIATAQMCFSILLVHFTGGRLETHFHIFGSLAFLAFYMEWQVVVWASLITGLDHLLRGIFLPESVYGVLTANPWRALEHVGWVFFEDFFLIIAIRGSQTQMRRAAEAQHAAMVSSQQANEANAMKSVFIANISHELRTPMHGILSFAALGAESGEGITPLETNAYFSEILQSGDRLMGLLNNLLDLSKLESGKMDYSMEPNVLEVVASRVQAELSALANEKKLTLRLESKNQSSLAYFDASRLAQVFRNILSNAIKFSKEESEILISFEPVADRVRVTIQNDGVGIPEDELKTIFDKFSQSSNTRKKSGGTGLGLSICQEIILHHQGQIWAESRPNQKTKFIFELKALSET